MLQTVSKCPSWVEIIYLLTIYRQMILNWKNRQAVVKSFSYSAANFGAITSARLPKILSAEVVVAGLFVYRYS